MNEKLVKPIAAAVGLFVVIAYLFHAWQYFSQLNDDAFITFRYSYFLAQGSGAVYNVGERVEGYTNFLLMLLIAGVIRVFGPDGDGVMLAARLIGIAGGLAACVAAWGICLAWLRCIETLRSIAPLLATGAAALVAVDASFAQNSTTGLETTLFAGLIALAVWADQVGRSANKWRGCGVLFALAGLTRPEGALVFVAFLAGRVLVGEWREQAGRRRIILDAVIVVAAVGAHVAFRHAYYDGEWLPNTYFAKTGGEAWSRSGSTYVGEFLYYCLGVIVPLLALAPLGASNVMLRNACVPALLAASLPLLEVLHAGADWMPGWRLLAPTAPLWSALGIAGLAVTVATLMNRRQAETSLALAALLPIGLFLWQTAARESLYLHVMTRAAGYRNGHIPLADWLNTTAKPGETVAMMDIGLVGYFCPQLRVLDITGLTDRHIAKSPGAFLAKDYDINYVLDQRPQTLVLVLYCPRSAIGFDFEKILGWTDIENRLISSPVFKHEYFRAQEVSLDRPETSSRKEQLQDVARLFGAERVFEHDYPDQVYYFLVAYRHRPPASAAARS